MLFLDNFIVFKLFIKKKKDFSGFYNMSKLLWFVNSLIK